MSSANHNNTSSIELFSSLRTAPPDPILDIKQRFVADKRSVKVDLSVGVYQDAQGETKPLPSVLSCMEHKLPALYEAGYLPIDGYSSFNQQIEKLALGAAHPGLLAGKVVTAQALGGTGALRYGAELLALALREQGSTITPIVYLPNPTWANHGAIFRASGFEVRQYPYLAKDGLSIDLEGILETLKNAPANSVVLLHTCCQNPCGVDPTPTEWQQILDLAQTSALVPFFDFAYHGFKESLEADRLPLEIWGRTELPFLVAYSCSKNFSMYRRRTGALIVGCASSAEAAIVRSQIKGLIRANNSNPPIDGAAIVAAILSDPALAAQWEQEVSEMRRRLLQMRKELFARLESAGSGDRFKSLLTQHGMFTYSGLSAAEVARLEAEFGVYAVSTGRICVAALNSNNLDYVADALLKVRVNA